MVDNNIGAMARQMAQKAGVTTPNDSTAKVRIQHLVKTGLQGGIAAAMKSLANISQVQEPTDSTTREITWPGTNTHYSGDIGVDAHWESDYTVTTSHTVMDYENGQVVGERHLEGDVTYHNEGEVPEEK